MPRAIRIDQTGGPEVLQWQAVEVGEPGAGQVRLRQEAAGLNFIDVYHRTGLYPQPLPFTPGVEGAGIELLRGMTVVRAVGRQSVTGAVLAPVDASGYALEGHARTFACDLIAVSGGATPSTSLLLQGGAKARYDEATGRFVADGLTTPAR